MLLIQRHLSRYYSPETVEEFEDPDGDVDVVDSPEDGCPSVTVDSIRATLDAAVAQDRDQLRRRLRNGEVRVKTYLSIRPLDNS